MGQPVRKKIRGKRDENGINACIYKRTRYECYVNMHTSERRMRKTGRSKLFTAEKDTLVVTLLGTQQGHEGEPI